MAFTNFPYGIASFGVPVIGGNSHIPPTTGKYFFVDSVKGLDNNNRGSGPDTPFDSIAYALTKCVANRGDVIVCSPEHAETISTATAFNASTANVSIIGLGAYGQRPTITVQGVVGATLTVSGSGVLFQNFVIKLNGIDSITVGVTITGADCEFRDCLFYTNSATGACTLPVSVGAARARFVRCKFDGTAAGTGSTSCIASSAALAGLTIDTCDINGNWSTAVVTSAGTNHITHLRVSNSIMRQTNGTAKNIFNLTTSSTGIIAYNVFSGTTWTTAADVASNSSSTSLRWFQNYGFDDGAGVVSGVLVPAVGTLA